MDRLRALLGAEPDETLVMAALWRLLGWSLSDCAGLLVGIVAGLALVLAGG